MYGGREKIKCVTDSLARELGVAKCKERRNTCNDNGDLTSNGEWAKCNCVAAGNGDEASACRFSFDSPFNRYLVFFFFFENQLRNKLGCKWFLFCYQSLKMGLFILLKFLILFRLKWILFELIYGVVWAIFGFRVQESGVDLCYCLSIFLI